VADLPFVDVHRVPVTASPEQLWASLITTVGALFSRGARAAWLLGCDPATGSRSFTGRVGQTLPGFQVVEAEVGHRLALAGRHRFSRYRLTFLIENGTLSAETRAEFPGIRGRLYRAAVIRSGGHMFLTRRMLRAIAA